MINNMMNRYMKKHEVISRWINNSRPITLNKIDPLSLHMCTELNFLSLLVPEKN